MVRIIGIVSGKGGVGKTVVTCNLGVALASMFKKRIVVIDCNLTTSHLSLYLGMNFDYSFVTLNDILKSNGSLDKATYIHPSGLKVVPASLKLEDLQDIEIEDFRNKLISNFKDEDIILLDSAPGLGKEALITLKVSDEILFVATPHIPSIVDITKCLYLLNKLEVKPIGIVLNRVKNKKYELGKREIEKLTGLEVLEVTPESDDVLKSTNSRVPVILLYPNSIVSQRFYRLAAKICGETYILPRQSIIQKILRFLRIKKPEEF
jgi:septum site-determining protein MinD